MWSNAGPEPLRIPHSELRIPIFLLDFPTPPVLIYTLI